MKIAVLILALAITLVGCSNEQRPVTGPTANPTEPPRPHRVRDYGDLKTYQACSAEPRRELVEIEKCQIKALSRNCTPVTDCLITCMSSPDGYKVGGGCYHICFGPLGGHSWQSRPDSKIYDECKALEPPANG